MDPSAASVPSEVMEANVKLYYICAHPRQEGERQTSQQGEITTKIY